VEEEERLKQEQASWSWDDMMKRMEDLEAREASGEGAEEDDKAKNEEESVEAQTAALKAKGNDAFARRRFQAAAQYYSQAIELDPTSHVRIRSPRSMLVPLSTDQRAFLVSRCCVVPTDSVRQPCCCVPSAEKVQACAGGFQRRRLTARAVGQRTLPQGVRSCSAGRLRRSCRGVRASLGAVSH